MFGATAEYHLHWEVDPVASTLKSYPSKYRSNTPLQTTHGDCSGISRGDEKYVCRYNGSTNAGASAAALVLGGSISILDTGFTSWAKDDQANAHAGAPTWTAHFTFLGDELYFPRSIPHRARTPALPGNSRSPSPSPTRTRKFPTLPSRSTSRSPDPLQLAGGVGLERGHRSIDHRPDWRFVPATCSPSWSTAVEVPGITRPVNPPNFGLASTVDPFIQVSGFAQVGVDLVFVQAGVRIDLEVVRLGIPITVGVSTGAQDSAPKAYAAFGTHAEATFEALSGELSAYVDVNYLAGSYHYEQPIFGWNGGCTPPNCSLRTTSTSISEGLNYQVTHRSRPPRRSKP